MGSRWQLAIAKSFTAVIEILGHISFIECRHWDILNVYIKS